MSEPSQNRKLLDVSVLLCSHNPRPAYLEQALAALRAQSWPRPQWELLLLDSACDEPLAGQTDLGWHPNARILRLDQPGKTRALLAGIAACVGQILVVVDDDNLVAPNYLEQAVRIARGHPEVGAWGGNVTLKFDTPPAEWTRRYWNFLAEQRVEVDTVVCNLELSHPLPVGAGCCVRRPVAEHYARQVAASPVRRTLGRNGKLLMAAEDSDLVLTACELGFKRGLFPALNLEHLIPPERLTEDYLTELVEGIAFSSLLLLMCRDRSKAPPRITWWWHVKLCCDCLVKFGRKRRFFLANKRAQKRARRLYETLPGEG